MARSSDSIESTLFSKPPLLMTESAEEFAALSAALAEELKPRGFVERMDVADIAAIIWEIQRLRRCKVVIINMAVKNAVHDIVNSLSGQPIWGGSKREWVENVARDWFWKPKAKKEVSKLLAQFRLDESAIEAEAIRSVFSEIEMLDRMLTLQESRRNKVLRSISDYRACFAKQVREVSNRVIEGSAVIQLEDPSVKKSA